MESRAVNLDCSSRFGAEDFTYLGPYGELNVKQDSQETTTITTHVSMVTGCYIVSGYANLNNHVVTLTYESMDNDAICFEQYSREISFTISTVY